MLYLGIVALLLRGIFQEKEWRNATVLNAVFMGSLFLGRLLSFIVDGKPSVILVFGLLGEMVLSVFAVYQLKKY